MKVVDGLYYPYSENKGTDKLRGYREADLRLCFRIFKKPIFSRRGSGYVNTYDKILKNVSKAAVDYIIMNDINL